MEESLKGKRVLVTGAGKSIGRDITIALHKCGANVVALSRTQEDLDSLQKECPGVQTVNHDISDWKSTKEVVGKLGHFDLLVNNAGVNKLTPFLEQTEEDLDRIMDTNFKSVYNVSQVVAKGMVEKGKGGCIVHVSSISSHICNCVGSSVYCSSKGAVDTLTKCMALELGPHQIRVNAVNPTIIDDTRLGKLGADSPDGASLLERTPLGRFGKLQDVTRVVLFLLSDYSTYMTGTTTLVDGGLLAR